MGASFATAGQTRTFRLTPLPHPVSNQLPASNTESRYRGPVGCDSTFCRNRLESTPCSWEIAATLPPWPSLIGRTIQCPSPLPVSSGSLSLSPYPTFEEGGRADGSSSSPVRSRQRVHRYDGGRRERRIGADPGDPNRIAAFRRSRQRESAESGYRAPIRRSIFR